MNMTLKQVKEELKRLSSIVNDEFDIDVLVNGRLTRTLGRVTLFGSKETGFSPTKMEFSKQFLETATVESIKDVVAHEWCHYYITKTTGENHGHNAQFKALCAKVGCVGTTSSQVNRTVEVQDKYELFCNDCGKKVAGFSRACKTTKESENYKSKCCDSSLKVVQNW